MLREFSDLRREHGEILSARKNYHEAACQLVFMAYLQRVVNGGGQIEQKYEVGEGRIDMLVRWPYQEGAWTNELASSRCRSTSRP